MRRQGLHVPDAPAGAVHVARYHVALLHQVHGGAAAGADIVGLELRDGDDALAVAAAAAGVVLLPGRRRRGAGFGNAEGDGRVVEKEGVAADGMVDDVD